MLILPEVPNEQTDGRKLCVEPHIMQLDPCTALLFIGFLFNDAVISPVHQKRRHIRRLIFHDLETVSKEAVVA